jgi:hypothetical protein
MRRYLLLLIFIPPFLLGLAGVLFTSNKLDRMRQIRGWKPGATIRTQLVHDRWVDNARAAYWISLTDEDIRVPGDHRLNLPPQVWNRYQAGDPIEVVYLPGDLSPYHREDIYAEDGNFVFDTGLLLVEGCFMLVSVFGAGLTFRWLRRTRQRPPATRSA